MVRLAGGAALALALVLSLPACKGKPGISSIEPASGSVSGYDDVVIRGSGFKSGMSVTFGTARAKRPVIKSNEIRVKTPPSKKPGPVDVLVTGADGTTYWLKQGFTYTDGK